MAIPNFQRLMLPLLEFAADGQVHTVAESVDTLASQIGLSDAERAELLPSGRQKRFDNRVAWARAHLKAAGLLTSEGRGTFRITAEGQSLLESPPEKITMAYLERYPSYVEFRTPKGGGQTAAGTVLAAESDATPEEALEASYLELRGSLAQELLDRVKASSPEFFERLVVDLLVAMGYGGSRQDAGEALGRSGDGGVDGVIREDKLGLDAIYLQAKRWQSSVGRPVVQAFAGSLEGVRARKGVMITTSTFTADAYDYVAKIEKSIVLIDGERLAELMIDHDVGVSPLAVYRIKRVDEDFFEGDVPSLAEATSEETDAVEIGV